MTRSIGERLVRGVFRLWASSYHTSFLQPLLYRPVHRAMLDVSHAMLRAARRRRADLERCGLALEHARSLTARV